MSGEFRREVRFDPGHVLRMTTGVDYGIASMQIRFLLHGEHGTTHWAMFSGWVPEKVPNGYRFDEWHHSAPSAFDLGAHWDTPWYEGMDDSAHRNCDFRPGGECWYDGSSLRAIDLETAFFKVGDAAVWSVLEDEYRSIDEAAAEVRGVS